MAGGDVWVNDNNQIGNWDTIISPVAGTSFQLGTIDNENPSVGGGPGNIYEFEYRGGHRIFLTRWGNSASADWGLLYSDDNGVTWQNYNTQSNTEGVEGL